MEKKIIFVIFLIINIFFFNNLIAQSQGTNLSQTSTENMIYKYYIKGIREYYNQNYNKACEYFRKFLDEKPSCNRISIMFKDAFEKYQSVEINLMQAEELYNNNYYEEAIPFLNNVLKIEPNNKRALKYLKECYKKLELTIKIVDKPTADGKEIKDRIISTDEELKLFAVGFDRNNNFLGPIKVEWYSTGTLEKIRNLKRSESLIFSPVNANTFGRIRAYIAKNKFSETGLIKVKEGKLNYFKIQTSTKLLDEEVKDIEIQAGEKIELYAHGFDKNGKYLGLVPVKWKIKGFVSKCSKKYSSSFLFISKKAGNGKLVIKAKNGYKLNIKVKVLPSEPYYFQIESAPGGTGYEIFSLKLLTGKKYIFYASAYDKYHNFVKNLKVNWRTTPSLEPIELNSSEKFEFIPTLPFVGGTIEVYKENMIGDKTGSIYIYPGDVYLNKEMKEMLIKKFEKRNKIVYFVKKDEILAKIVSVLLNLPYKWKKIYKYVYAIGDYNRLPDKNLILINQPICIPFFKIESKTTKEELAQRLFGNRNMKDKIVVYGKSSNIIEPDDKIIIIDEDFLKTGDIKYVEAKYK